MPEKSQRKFPADQYRLNIENYFSGSGHEFDIRSKIRPLLYFLTADRFPLPSECPSEDVP